MATRSRTGLQETQPADIDLLVLELREVIDAVRSSVARSVDGALTALCWSIGHRVGTVLLDESRAAYGERIVSAVGRQLPQHCGSGPDEKSLRHMIQIAAARERMWGLQPAHDQEST